MSITGKITDLIYKVAVGNFRTKLILTPIVTTLFLGMVAIFIFLSFISDRLLHFPNIISEPWNLLIGCSLIMIGFVLMMFSIVCFVQVKGTPVPLNPPSSLVVNGPYKYMRNPMLTGIFIQLFGLGVLCHSLSLLCIFTPLFIILNILELKKIEEPELEKRLGEKYLEYKNKTPMFFPFSFKKFGE